MAERFTVMAERFTVARQKNAERPRQHLQHAVQGLGGDVFFADDRHQESLGHRRPCTQKRVPGEYIEGLLL